MKQEDFNAMMDKYIEQKLMESPFKDRFEDGGTLCLRYIQDTFGSSNLCFVIERKQAPSK
jgi:hypothetical protein